MKFQENVWYTVFKINILVCILVVTMLSSVNNINKYCYIITCFSLRGGDGINLNLTAFIVLKVCNVFQLPSWSSREVFTLRTNRGRFIAV